MFLKTEIFDTKPGELEQEVWRFILLDNKLILDEYRYKTRRTKRCGWNSDKHWNRIDGRNNNIKLAEIPIPDDLKDKAKEFLFKQIEVTIDWKS